MKRKRGEDEFCWRKKSIIYELPYWHKHKLRHNLDVMHINLAESLVGTMMDVEGKTKDHLKARMDLELFKYNPELHPYKDGDATKWRPAPYVLQPPARKQFCDYLRRVKFPDGYASNISRCVQVKDNKLVGMKSHDYHILLQRLLPLAIRGKLPS